VKLQVIGFTGSAPWTTSFEATSTRTCPRGVGSGPVVFEVQGIRLSGLADLTPEQVCRAGRIGELKAFLREQFLRKCL